MGVSRDLAKTIHKVAERKARRTQSDHQLAKIVRVKPLMADPIDLDYMLHEDDIQLSQWVRSYKENTGLSKGETLILHFISGQWVAVDVLSDILRPLKIKKSAGGQRGEPDISSAVEAEEVSEEEAAESGE